MYLNKKYFHKIVSQLAMVGLLQVILFSSLFPAGLHGNNRSTELAWHAAQDNPTISGPASVCSGMAGYVYSTEPGMNDYVWTISAGGTITSGAGTNSITVTWSVPGNETLSVIYATAVAPATLNVTVFPILPVGITIAASANPVCAGTMVTFTATPVNGGTSPVYQWKVNGITVGNNSNTFAYSPAAGDVVGCQLTSGLTCTTNNPATAVPVTMAVNPNLPASVSISASANPVCFGTQVTYVAVPVNGGSAPSFQWKVNGINAGSNSTVFTLTPVTGDVVTCQMTSNATCTSGNPSMSNAVTMTVSPSQPVSVAISASANPACTGVPVTFTATPVNGGASPAYQWFVNGTMAGTGSAVYTYIPVQGDLVSCQLTSNAACTVGNPATSNTLTMVINQNQPVSVTITASANSVCQGNPVTFTAFPANGGTSPGFQWSINGFNVGTNSGTFTCVPANGDVVSCQLTSSLACTTGNPAASNPIVVNVMPVLPVNITISGSANPVCIGTTVTYTASLYNGGTSPVYQWKVNGVNAGSNNPVYSYVPVNGDVIVCQLTSNALCVSGNNALSNAVTMTVSANQPVGVSIAAASTTVCEGMTADFTATPVNGGSSPAYQWKVNGINAGTNSSYFSYLAADGDVVTCIMTSSAICTTGNPVLSNPVTMVVTAGQTLPVSITINASANPGCFGQQVTYTATPVNGGSTPVYQWFVNGLTVGTNTPSFSYIPSSGDFIKCQLTSSYICATGNPAISNQVSMTVNPILAPGISIVGSANPSCQGLNVTFSATAVNAGATPVYQWKVNGSNAGTNQATYTYAPVSGDIVMCQLTSSVPCPVSNPVVSNSITMSVLPVQPVGVSIATATNPSCQFTQVTYTATPVNGGTSPVYQWKMNGINVGSNNPIFSYIPVTGDIITCQLTSNALCYTGSRIAVSNTITMTVSTELPAGVSITTALNPFCQGVPVSFTATPVNGGNTPAYQWKVNCLSVGTNSSILSYTPANGDFVTCQMTSSLTCAVMNPAISNAITMLLNTSTPAGVSVAASANPVCQSTAATLTATPVNGGSLPAYQWKVNGVITGSNSSTLTYTPTNGDAVTCRLTSNATCVSGSPVTSATVNMGVSTALPASVSIVTATNPFCPGTSVIYTATPVNGGSSPSYQWQVNGVNSGVPSGSPAFTFSPANGDAVKCLLTSNASCISGSNPVTSNQLVMSAAASLPVAISVAASVNNVCQGTAVTFTATPANGGNNPVLQWMVNGLNAGTNSPVYTYAPANGDLVSCRLTSDLACATANPALSNVVAMTVNPVLPVSVSIAASANPCCSGTVVTFTATPTNGGGAPNYQWKVNCQNAGSNSPTFTYTPINGDVVVCILTSNALCSTGSPAISNNINMVVLPRMPVSLSIFTLVNPFCIGTAVTFTALPVNEGATPVYQWKVNGNNAGTNSITFVYQPANADVVTCELTSGLTCVSGNPATSNPIIMMGNTGLPVSVEVVSNWNNTNNVICQGTTVTYTATPTNGGAAPAYQWKVNGINKGNNFHMYEYLPANGDVITCQVTSNLNCASLNPATSNAITMTVYPNLPLSTVIAASANPSCLGNTVSYSSTVTNGGTNPTYRWRVNGINAGTNIPTFSYVPVNNDVVLCFVTSSELCHTGSPGNSNSITMVVSPTTPANVTIAPSANPVCQGTLVTFLATPFNGGSLPAYQWKVNGINSGTNSPSFVYAPANGDVVTCQMTSNSPCIAVTQVTSNPVTMTVSQIQPVSISIVASSNPTCIGSVVTFNAAPVNGGTSPVYQWKVNGVVVGASTLSYTYTPLNGDVITCRLTSNASCTTGNPAISNTITMTVSESLAVGVSIAAASNPSCQGQQVNYLATPVHGGANPVFLWRVNGIDVGQNSSDFSYTPSNGDFVMCQLTSSFSCGTGNPATSNQINTMVHPYVPVSISIVSSANPVCQSTPVTFTASAINGGTAPAYQWRVNGLNAGSNQPAYTFTAVNGDVVDCQLTSNATCPLNNPVGSTPVTMTVLQPIAAGISITPSLNPICPGTSVTFTSTITNGGNTPLLQWMVNGSVVASNVPVFTYIPLNGDLVTCQLTSSATCVTGATTTSNQVMMVVSSNLTVNVSIAASSNPSCQSQVVTYTATGMNGGAAPVYQWMVNGINVGTNNPVFGFTPANGDVVTCQLLSDMTCASGNPALSNPVTMVVSQNLPASVSIVVSSNPVCLGSIATYQAIPVNAGIAPVYQWNVNGANVGSNLPTFGFIPANGDVVMCQIISGNECTAGELAFSNPIVMVVSTDLPVGVTVVAVANPVCLGTTATFTAVPANGGNAPACQWKVNGNPAGLNSTTYSYAPADGDVVSCVLTSDLPCATGNPATSNAVVMSVYSGQAASVNLMANPAGMVCEGAVVNFTAIPVNGGSPFYQWYKNGLPVGSNLQNYSCIPQNGDLIHVVMTSGLLCVSGSPATSNVVAMVVSAALPASVSIVADQNNVCQGTPVTFSATPANGGGSASYQWLVNGLPVGTNLSSYSYSPVNGDQVNVTMTSSLSCVSGSPAVSNTVVMAVTTPLPVGVSIGAGQNNICQGTSVTFTATPVNGGTPAYQWYKNNLPVGLNQPTYTIVPANGDQVYAVMTSTLSCISGSPASSNTITMVVNPILPVSVSVAPDQNNICQGTSVTFNATAVNSGTASYQWYKNSLPVGLNLPTYTTIPNNNDQVYVVITSTLACISGSPATSNVVTMVVNTTLPASVSIVASQNNICQGTPVTYTATPENGGGSASYQWFVNGLPVGSNLPSYSYSPANGDQVNVTMTSGLSCVSGSPANSNTVVMAVTTPLPVGVTIVAGQNNICQGTSVTFTATPVNGGTPAYQWYKNNLPVGLNQPTYTIVPANGDQVYAVMTSTLSCISGSPASSNTITMVVNPILPVSVSVAPDQNNICQGTTVTFSATPVNGGTASCQWYKNSLPVGLNLPAYTTIPNNNDQVYVVITSTLACISGSPATSNVVTMVVNATLPASVSIVASQNNLCQGTPVTYTATPANGGGSASYQWHVNGLPVGINLPAYSYIPANGDQVNVTMTSGLSCVSGSPATSNTVVMAVTTPLPVGVSIVSDQNNVCQGTSVTFTASPVNGGTPAYQWYKNNLPVGLNQPTYTIVPANGDQVYVVMTSTMSCISGSPASSNTITMVVNPILPVSVSVAPDQNNICQGTTVTFSATPVNGGTVSFQWYKNSLPVGLNLPTYTFVPANGDQVYVVMTSTLACISGSPATSNVVTMVVNATLPASVTIVANQNNICLGTLVTYTATPANGGGSASYQWHVNGLPVGTNLPAYSYSPANGDQVNVTMTSGLSCVSGSPATSNTVVMAVTTPLQVGVSIVSDQNNVCQGTSVTFTASPVNGGTPAYQWYKNNLPVGLNQPAYTIVPANGDQVYVVMTSTLACISGSPASSNTITMVVNPILPVSVSIAPDQNNICQGTTVTFTATPVNGGTASFQWYKNSLPVGLNLPTYTTIPNNNDQVYVVMTSTLACISGSPATSNAVTMVVNATLPASVSIVEDQNNICQGTLVTYTATPVNGGGSASYQWHVNGLPVGTNLPVYSYFPANGDQVNVTMTSGLLCVSGSPAVSNTVVMAVTTPLQVGVSIVSDQNNVCQGTSVVFTATPVNGGTPAYQWYKNNLPVGLNQPTYTIAPANGDQVYVVMTSTLSCISGSPASSNTITMVVNPVLPVSVSIAPDQNNICLGTQVTFTATPANGGGSASYQWYVNGLPVGINLFAYSYSPANGDQVNVIMTSSLMCVSGSPATSNTVAMTVTTPLQVGVSIVSDQNNMCQGTSVTFTAIPVNGGTPAYQWYKNNLPVGLNQPTYTIVPDNGDQVYVVVTSTLSCITGSPASSNTIAIVVNPMAVAGVSIFADQNNICQGTSVTFTATPVNGGTASYQWYKNNLPVGLNLPTYTTIPDNNDQVYAVMTSTLACLTGNPASSDIVSMAVTSAAGDAGAISGISSVCAGSEGVLFSVPPILNSVTYLWSLPAGATITGGNNSSGIMVNFSSDASSGDITVTGSNSCGAGKVSPVFHVTVNPVPATPAVELQWPVLQSSLPEGNQWYYEDTLISGANGQTYTALQPGWYWSVVTQLGCSSDTSNHVYVDETNPGSIVPGILVYPVPNNGQFTISITLLVPETFNILIFNTLGEKIYELSDVLVTSKFKQLIDLRPIPRGVYSVLIKCRDYKVVKRILINRK